MKLVGILFLFFGYVFVYASVAAKGRFASEPWAALFADAYTDASTTTEAFQQTAAQTLGGPASAYTPLSPKAPFAQ